MLRIVAASASATFRVAGISPTAVASLDNLPDGWRTVAPYLSEVDQDPRVLIVGGMVGILAGWMPARLAAKLDILDAIATE